MRRLILSLFAFLFALALVGCSSESAPSTAPAPAAPAPAPYDPPAPSVSEDELFLQVLENTGGNPLSDAQALEFAEVTCDALRGGVPASGVVEAALANSYDAEMAGNFGRLIGAAVGVYCPEYKSDFEAVLGVGLGI